MGCHVLLQGIFLTQGSNPGLLHCRQILYHLSHQGCPFYYFGEGDGTPLQYSCLENPMDGGAWWAAVHGAEKSWTPLSDFTFSSVQFSLSVVSDSLRPHFRHLQRLKGRGNRLCLLMRSSIFWKNTWAFGERPTCSVAILGEYHPPQHLMYVLNE